MEQMNASCCAPGRGAFAAAADRAVTDADAASESAAESAAHAADVPATAERG